MVDWNDEVKWVKGEQGPKNETFYFPSGDPLAFDIDVEDTKRLVSARLVIGLHRNGGITKPLLLDVNGTTIEVDSGDASEFTEFFAPLDAILSPQILRDQNKLNIKAEAGTTITSVHLVTFAETEL
jgi:hypothetical protein